MKGNFLNRYVLAVISKSQHLAGSIKLTYDSVRWSLVEAAASEKLGLFVDSYAPFYGPKPADDEPASGGLAKPNEYVTAIEVIVARICTTAGWQDCSWARLGQVGNKQEDVPRFHGLLDARATEEIVAQRLQLDTTVHLQIINNHLRSL